MISEAVIGRRRPILAGMSAVMAVNAFGGAWYALAGAPNVPRKWLHGTPFRTYAVPGAILGGVVGGSQVVAGALLARGSRHGRAASLGASGILLAWITTQLAMIGYVSPLQPAVLAWALVTLWLAAVPRGG